MRKNFDKAMIYAAYAYVIIPYVIFILGWVRWYYAAAITGAIAIATFLALKRHTAFKYPDISKHTGKIVATLLIVFVWVYFSGIGNYSYQRLDHLYRNALFRDLIEHKWPVVYNNIDWLNNGRSSKYMMAYYIGFWMPAALVGKMFGWAAANFAAYLWACAGVLLVFYFVCRLLNSFSIKQLVVFIFFGTMYMVGLFIRLPLKAIVIADTFLWADNMLIAGSTTGLLYEVFNQCLVPWLVLLLLLNDLPKRNVFFLYPFVFFQGPFAFIGLFPFVAYYCLKYLFDGNETGTVKDRFLSFFSFQNIVGLGMVMLPLYLYMSANASAQRFEVLHPRFFKYFQFILLSFMILAGILFTRYRREPLYYISLVILLVVPFWRLGHGMDLCGRVSIPAMFILMIFTMRLLQNNHGKTLKIVIVGYLCLSAIEPALIIGRSIFFTVYHATDKPQARLLLYNRQMGYPEWTNKLRQAIPDSLANRDFLRKDFYATIDLRRNAELENFISNTDQSKFYKLLAKHN